MNLYAPMYGRIEVQAGSDVTFSVSLVCLGSKKYPLDGDSRGYFCAQKQEATPVKKRHPYQNIPRHFLLGGVGLFY